MIGVNLLVVYFGALLYCFTCDNKIQCLRTQPTRTQPYPRLLAKYEKTKINCSNRKWLDIVFWVLQGSIHGPLLITIVFVILFFVLDYIDVANYAHNNTTYVMVDNVDAIIASMESASKTWF